MKLNKSRKTKFSFYKPWWSNVVISLGFANMRFKSAWGTVDIHSNRRYVYQKNDPRQPSRRSSTYHWGPSYEEWPHKLDIDWNGSGKEFYFGIDEERQPSYIPFSFNETYPVMEYFQTRLAERYEDKFIYHNSDGKLAYFKAYFEGVSYSVIPEENTYVDMYVDAYEKFLKDEKFLWTFSYDFEDYSYDYGFKELDYWDHYFYVLKYPKEQVLYDGEYDDYSLEPPAFKTRRDSLRLAYFYINRKFFKFVSKQSTKVFYTIFFFIPLLYFSFFYAKNFCITLVTNLVYPFSVFRKIYNTFKWLMFPIFSFFYSIFSLILGSFVLIVLSFFFIIPLFFLFPIVVGFSFPIFLLVYNFSFYGRPIVPPGQVPGYRYKDMVNRHKIWIKDCIQASDLGQPYPPKPKFYVNPFKGVEKVWDLPFDHPRYPKSIFSGYLFSDGREYGLYPISKRLILLSNISLETISGDTWHSRPLFEIILICIKIINFFWRYGMFINYIFISPLNRFFFFFFWFVFNLDCNSFSCSF